MVSSGDILIDSARGQKIIFRRTAQETQGELLEMEVSYQPSSSLPPEHLHPKQEEHFEVLAGSIKTCIRDQENVYHTGETFIVPAGIPHKMWNNGQAEARLCWQTRPALRTEDFFEMMFGLVKDGKTNQQGIPNILQTAVIMRQYRQEFRLTKPPYIVQIIVFGLFAPLGRLLGYRSKYKGE